MILPSVRGGSRWRPSIVGGRCGPPRFRGPFAAGLFPQSLFCRVRRSSDVAQFFLCPLGDEVSKEREEGPGYYSY